MWRIGKLLVQLEW